MNSTEHILPVMMTETEQQEILRELSDRGSSAQLTEWGSGGSTLLWLANMTENQTLVSIEDNTAWISTVESAVEQLRQEQPVPATFSYHRITGTEDDGATFEPEHSYYENYVLASDDRWAADIFLIDGKVRLWCARAVLEHAIKRDCTIYCHDYAHNRGHWDQIRSLFSSAEEIATEGTEYVMLKLKI